MDCGAQCCFWHWLGRPDPDDRTALAIASSMRHPGVALAIARLNFPEEMLVQPQSSCFCWST